MRVSLMLDSNQVKPIRVAEGETEKFDKKLSCKKATK